jgi:hypothetical protein
MNERSASGIADVEHQANALLDLIEADRARQCGAILDEANGRASTVRAYAGNEARVRVRQAFAEQRQRRHDQLAAGEARLATRRRLHEQRRIATLLQLAWQHLPSALRALWQQEHSRANWIHHVLTYARDRLQADAWHILHSADWPAHEREALPSWLLNDAHVELRFEADASIEAGLKVMGGRNVIDGTIGGLLADRAEIEALLLRQLEARA